MKIAAILLIFFMGLKLKSQIPTNDPHWKLVFEDDFNFFDNTKWLIAEGCDLGGNNTIILPQNVSTNNGHLQLTLKHETYNCPHNQPYSSYICGICIPGQHSYTSGWVETKVQHKLDFGYIEARIKVSDLIGIHSAFWTFSATTNPSLPYNEIDIFEMIPGNPLEECDNNNKSKIITSDIIDGKMVHNKNIMTTNIHPLSADGCDNPFYKATYINDYTKWHTYGIEWSPSKMIWYVDNSVVRIATNPNIIYSQAIILGVGPFGDGNLLNNMLLPIQMEVDYVKLYQKQEDCNNLINACAYNFATHDNQVKNSITIGDNGCSNSVAVGSNTTIRASEFIALNGEVTFPLGSEFYADANGECAIALDMRCSQIFNPCFFNFSNYDNQVKQLIALGGTNCLTTITSASNLTLQATESITLNAGVTILPQSGKSIVLETKNCPQ